jgi:phosphocarrier protein
MSSMLRREVLIVNKLGLHARAAAKFVTLASRFDSDVRLTRGARTVNGKSIMGVMMLAAAKGAVLELVVEGRDEAEAVEALVQLVGERFGEAE